MRVLSLFAILLLVAGCAPDEPTVVDDPDAVENGVDDFNDAEGAEWRGTLQSQAGYEDVSATATAHVLDGRTHVIAEISGAEPGATHPWHVHQGACESGGGIVGAAGAYPALQVGDDGRASAEGTIDVTLDAGASYHVNVHASPDDLGTIVACGNLQAN
jgi:hypothetical protein